MPDAATLSHLAAWIEREVRDEDAREPIQIAMLREYADDPDYWSQQDWRKLYDAIGGFAIEQGFER